MSNNENRIPVGDHVKIYTRGKKRIYVADFWHDGKHCRKSMKTRNRQIAMQRAIQLASQLQEGINPSHRTTQKRITIQQAADEFLSNLKTERRRKRTSIKYKGQFKKFIAFAATQGISGMNKVDLSLIDRYRGARVSEISERTLSNDGRALKTFLGWCAERHLIAANPLASKIFRRPKYEPRGGPSLAQIDAVLAIASRDLRAIIAVAAFTGRRSSEIQHLLREDVDFPENWIHVVSRPGAETKSGNSGKTPIHSRLRRILETLPKSNSKWFFTAPASAQFPNGDHHLNMRDVNEQFQKLLVQLKIPAGKKRGGFTFHSLRSFFKTHCVNAGIPREIVDTWQDHRGDHRPSASDLYYRLTDEVSQDFMRKVPFGDGIPAANAGVQEKKE